MVLLYILSANDDFCTLTSTAVYQAAVYSQGIGGSLSMEFMTENVVSSLYPYQIENIERQIIDYQSLNLAEKKTDFDMCPKCGAVHPRLIKGGEITFWQADVSL